MSESQSDLPIILVCGFGRCGSSLVMQMLAAAGIACVGPWPSFELPDETHYKRVDWAAMPGKAIKVLDPHRIRPPIGLNYRIVWLDRDVNEQAKSMLKMLNWAGTKVVQDPQTLKLFRKRLRRDRRYASAYLQRIGGRVVPQAIAFEHILKFPVASAQAILHHVRPGVDPQLAVPLIEKMAACVRFRSFECLDFMLEDKLVQELPVA